MLDHHLQRSIIYHLAFSESQRFSELKPDDIESKLFDYHLKKVIAAGYVIKNKEGLYTLTAKGRLVDITGFKNRDSAFLRAHSVLLLAIRRKKDGAWLLYRRYTHPLRDLVGFMHATPSSLRDSSQQAAKECREKTGLAGDFTVLGNGYFRVFDAEAIESFTHFTLLYCDDIKGNLEQNSEFAEYLWMQKPDFTHHDMLPNMQDLGQLYLQKQPFHIERTFHL